MKFSSEVKSDEFFFSCVIIVAAVHLSNYFYSGLGKLLLKNGGVLTWLLHNETYILSVHATDMKLITIQNILPAAGIDLNILPLIIALNTPINIAVLLFQLCSVICLLSLKKSAALTVFYDTMHVGIFLLTGIFFWKWIILNAAFIFSFNALRASGTVKLPMQVFGCLVVIAAPLFFHIATLAWFDTGAVNEAYFEATTADGTNVRVPSNFFLDSSIDVAIQRFSSPYTGFLPTGTWGTTGDAETLDRVTSNCEAETFNWTLPHPDWARVNTLIQSQQRRALVMADNNGHLNYDTYPHHIWSAPWLFPQFTNLDIRTVKSYRLIVRSDCVYIDDGGTIQRKPAGRATYEFPLQTGSAS